jgi:hypothetical protein
MEEFHPLTDIWDVYTDSLDNALVEGYINDDEIAENYLWPLDLQIVEHEQEDMKKYVHERMVEIVERIKYDQGLDPNLIAAMIFRSVMCGMMWEKERIGK